MTIAALAAMGGTSAKAAGTTSAEFLKMGAGARAAGMGDAFTSVSDDVTAVYWNPAGLSQIKATEAALMHTAALENTQYQFAAAAIPLHQGTLGLSLYRLDYGTLDRYSASDTKDGSFTAGSMAADLSWGMKMSDQLRLGATVKYISESIESVKASGVAADFGALYQVNGYNFGATIQHIGPSMKFVQEKSSLPQTVRLGASRHFSDNLLVATDLTKSKDSAAQVGAGVEYSLSKILFRAGYKASSGLADVSGLTKVTAGLGVNLGDLNLDYAIAPFGELGAVHKVSLRYQFSSR